MKRKGFTLIELLAVIVILAVIAIIVIPIILGVIENVQKEAAESSVLGYLAAVEKQIIINQLDETKTDIIDGVYDLPMEGITVKGELPSEGWIVINDSKVTHYSMRIMNYVATVNNEISKNAQLADKPEDINMPELGYICKRATTLHTEECTQKSSYCYDAGYSENGGKGTTLITYGNLGTDGVLKSGDAFDCDVNGDGKYDSETERFYYLSNYYNTTTKKFETDKAVLIYYNNTTKGEIDNTSNGLIAYYANASTGNVNYGPYTAITNLPTTKQWKNIKLLNNKRAILTETGSSSIVSNTLSTEFSYEEYAARLLTINEVSKACGVAVGNGSSGDLDKCNYLMENTKYSSSIMGTYGYWIENFKYNSSNSIYGMDSATRRITTSYSGLYSLSTGNAIRCGTRPVIEILKTDILY